MAAFSTEAPTRYLGYPVFGYPVFGYLAYAYLAFGYLTLGYLAFGPARFCPQLSISSIRCRHRCTWVCMALVCHHSIHVSRRPLPHVQPGVSGGAVRRLPGAHRAVGGAAGHDRRHERRVHGAAAGAGLRRGGRGVEGVGYRV